VAALKERLSIAEKKVESLTADLDRVQEEKESLDEDMIEMKMNNDMVENELDDLKESLQDMIPRKEFEKHKMDYNNTISNSKKQLEDLKKQITLKDQEITKLKGENLQLKSKVNKRPSKISPQAVNHDLVKRFHKLRAECIYYQRESKRLKVQLKESCMRESLSYGLDDIDDMPDSPTAVDFLEGDNIFELDTSMHPKASQPRSMAALAKDRRESSNSSTSTKSMSPPSPIARRRSTPSQFSLSPILTPTSASDTPRRRKSGTIDPSPITSTTPTSPKARSSSASLRSSETPVSTIEKVQLRKSGLIPPRPNTNSTSTTTQKPIPKGKSKQSKLMKFVNARNSEKMLNCKPLPVPITPTASSISNTSSKATSAQQAAKAILPSSTASIPTEKAVADKNATSIEKSASVRGTKRPVTQADIEKAMEKAFKKVKPAATMNSKIALMEEHLKTGSMPNLQDITGHLTEFVDEIDELYSTMNSPAEPVNKDPTTVGHPNILQMDLPQGMVQREKICILLVCLLAKHNVSRYFSFSTTDI
jgi:hypothetical protein